MVKCRDRTKRLMCTRVRARVCGCAGGRSSPHGYHAHISTRLTRVQSGGLRCNALHVAAQAHSVAQRGAPLEPKSRASALKNAKKSSTDSGSTTAELPSSATEPPPPLMLGGRVPSDPARLPPAPAPPPPSLSLVPLPSTDGPPPPFRFLILASRAACATCLRSLSFWRRFRCTKVYIYRANTAIESTQNPQLTQPP
jgi:hypothetical protein